MRLLTAYFIANISDKNMYVKIIASQRWEVFETRCGPKVLLIGTGTIGYNP